MFVWICLGGALGTGARYLVGLGTARLLSAQFPYATLAVNLIGSFLVSLLMFLSVEAEAIPLPVKMVLTTGFLGGFTTYASFNYETIKLFQSGAWLLAATNVVVTVLACIMAGLLGLAVGARLT